MNAKEARQWSVSMLTKRTKKELIDYVILLRGDIAERDQKLSVLRAEEGRLHRMLDAKDKELAEYEGRNKALRALLGPERGYSELSDWWNLSHKERLQFARNKCRREEEALDRFRRITQIDHDLLSDRGFKEVQALPIRTLLGDYPELATLREFEEWTDKHRTRILKVLMRKEAS